VLFGFDGSRIMARKTTETFRDREILHRTTCGSAEHLPFGNAVFHKVYCKGAVDHFYNPHGALEEMARVLRPGGWLVVSVANFESLGCRLGRLYNRLHRSFRGRELPRPHFWEIPRDHLHRFHHPFLMECLPATVRLERDRGISLLWGFPRWGELLRALPEGLSRCLLVGLDRVARVNPWFADVIVIRARRLHDSRPERAGSNGEIKMKNYSRVQGMLLCLGTILAAILFLIGICFESYWALAIPVAIGFLWLLGLGFWIGWTLLTIRVEPPRE
jgi:SAM-dependent methyltransferase